MNQLDPNHTIPRRTVTTALAWSVPVIAVAVATPLAAASPSAGIAIGGPEPIAGTVGESLALAFTVTDGGADVASGALTVVLNDTATLEFDPDADGYGSATTATVEIVDGVAVAVVLLNADGTATGTATFGSFSTSFSAVAQLV